MKVSELIDVLQLMDPDATVLADTAVLRCFSITRIDHVDQTVVLHSTMADGSPDGEKVSPDEPMVSEVSLHTKDYASMKDLGIAIANGFENGAAIPLTQWVTARTLHASLREMMRQVSDTES